jgi:hypothetical protein
MRTDLPTQPNPDDIKKEGKICFMPYDGGTPPHVVATVPSTLWRTCLIQELKTLST